MQSRPLDIGWEVETEIKMQSHCHLLEGVSREICRRVSGRGELLLSGSVGKELTVKG